MEDRRRLKPLFVAAAGIFVAPLSAVAMLGLRLGSEAMFHGAGRFLSLCPGRLGQYLRAGYYTSLIPCGKDLSVGFFACITSPRAVLGAQVAIGSFANVGHALVGDGSVIEAWASVGREASPVCIRVGAGVVVGESSIILADLADGVVVRPGSVVVRDVPRDAVVSGNPARVAMERPGEAS